MAEYIDREAVKSKKVYCGERHEYVVPVAEIDWSAAKDVAPVVHGRWLKIPGRFVSVASKEGRDYYGNATSCSVCHEVNPNAFKTNYCPICGARMDKEE